MTVLSTFLDKLKQENAERLLFAPRELAQAFDGDKSWPISATPIRAATLLEAVFEVLSQDELQSIPTNRPRIVRHEHDGTQYVLEIARDGENIRLGVRLGKPTLRRDSFRESASAPPAASSARPPDIIPEKPKRADKRTVRVDVDDEGNPVDTTTVDIDRRASLPQQAAVKSPPKRETKQVKRASSAGFKKRPVHQTIIVPPAGKPAGNTVISGDPYGAHVTFLHAPGGFALESVAGVVTASADGAVVRGELFVPPSMKLRILQGPKEAIVSYYRHPE